MARLKLAEAIKRGEPAGTALSTIDQQNFLPMLRWVLATGQEQGSLVAALHNLADLYRKRANYQAEKLYVFLPTILIDRHRRDRNAVLRTRPVSAADQPA